MLCYDPDNFSKGALILGKVKKIILTILFVIIGVGALLGLAILVDGSRSGNLNTNWISKFLDFFDGSGIIIGRGIRLSKIFFP